MKIATNLFLASLLALYFSAGFSIVSFASLGNARNNEIHTSKGNDLSNLDESICHNAGEKKSPEKVINDEPIRPGINREEKKKRSKKTKKIEVVLTGYYTPEPNQPWYLNGSFARERSMNGKGKLTASGTVPQRNWTIAADPRFLPPGTKIRIEGFDGVFRVEDTGGSIKGKKLDFYTGRGFSALKEAMNLPRTVVIEIL